MQYKITFPSFQVNIDYEDKIGNNKYVSPSQLWSKIEI